MLFEILDNCQKVLKSEREWLKQQKRTPPREI